MAEFILDSPQRLMRIKSYHSCLTILHLSVLRALLKKKQKQTATVASNSQPQSTRLFFFNLDLMRLCKEFDNLAHQTFV